MFSREVWTRLLQPQGWQHVLPNADLSLGDWWIDVRKPIVKPRKRAFDSMILLISEDDLVRV
jgi:hypothetical protein